jgi:hypothetical protein
LSPGKRTDPAIFFAGRIKTDLRDMSLNITEPGAQKHGVLGTQSSGDLYVIGFESRNWRRSLPTSSGCSQGE